MKINIISSTRADIGLLKNLIAELKEEKSFSTSTIIGGTHFAKRFDYTYKEIIKNKIKINNKIVFKSIPDSILGISKVFSKSFIKSVEIFEKDKPDLIIVLGDRYEILASVIAANLSKIPVAHIHGGEVTHGAIDDAFRHSITKMSHIHFVSHKEHKQRIIQLGENRKNIFIIGPMAVDNIRNTKLYERKYLEKKFNLKFRKNNFLVNFHPETLSNYSTKKQINEIIGAMKKLKTSSIIFTMPGADKEYSIIQNEIMKFDREYKNVYFFKSLGEYYFSFLNEINAMIGNSSSGIYEMPYFNKPTINLGNRQSGRIMDANIINVQINQKNILNAINQILNPRLKKKILKKTKLFPKYSPSKRIVKILKNLNLSNKFFEKKFFDIKFNNQ